MSAQARLDQVRYAVQRGLSQRRACALMRAARSGLHYELRMLLKDAPVIEAMKDLSGQFPRFGARRIRVFLERQAMQMGRDRCSRIWSAAGLQVPSRKKRRRHLTAARPRPMPPKGRNSVWCYDFVFDSCANGQQLKCLTVVDEYTRECLAMEWFRNRLEAKVIIQAWRRHYNEIRPHSSLNYRTPAEFIAGLKSDLSTETKKSS